MGFWRAIFSDKPILVRVVYVLGKNCSARILQALWSYGFYRSLLGPPKGLQEFLLSHRIEAMYSHVLYRTWLKAMDGQIV